MEENDAMDPNLPATFHIHTFGSKAKLAAQMTRAAVPSTLPPALRADVPALPHSHAFRQQLYESLPALELAVPLDRAF
ncbi:hypothetical protein PC121_g22098 [Phytophthora cactorum]|nr:hypothetical protein PC120_g23631 [Phytophthora cactorum]KAG3044145.1 hypothetical protein PC121_g22098 [Phytophthora cactorum]